MFVPGRFYKQYLELILAEMTEKNQVSKNKAPSGPINYRDN